MTLKSRSRSSTLELIHGLFKKLHQIQSLQLMLFSSNHILNIYDLETTYQIWSSQLRLFSSYCVFNIYDLEKQVKVIHAGTLPRPFKDEATYQIWSFQVESFSSYCVHTGLKKYKHENNVLTSMTLKSRSRSSMLELVPRPFQNEATYQIWTSQLVSYRVHRTERRKYGAQFHSSRNEMQRELKILCFKGLISTFDLKI